MSLGCDWTGYYGGPPGKGHCMTGNVLEPNVEDYKVVICQQPIGDDWLAAIKAWKKKGIIVLFDCDDFLHGVRRIEGHRFQQHYNKKLLKKVEASMAVCDGLILSTDFLAQQYKKYNPNTFVCKNGIETKRYDIKIPQRSWVAVGWAGGTGHDMAIRDWVWALIDLMDEIKEISFVSVGIEYADVVNNIHPHRALSVPWVSLENFPYALTNIDINLAPAHVSKYYKSKSNLRYLQASALGIPSVVDPVLYKEVEHNKTGLCATDTEEFKICVRELVKNERKRKLIGQRARDLVRKEYDSGVTAEQWVRVFESL